MLAELIFFIAVALIAYTWAGYPLLALALSRWLARPVRRAEITPPVSIIIAAYNEERDLAAKLENTLALDYPPEQLEIIVASDCSTDRTDAIVRSFARRGVKLFRQSQRHGKTIAQNQAVSLSTGEILVFSDATTIYERDALRRLVRSFADPEVGGVAGQLVYLDCKTTAVGKGCRSYWGYEKLLRLSESRLGSLIGVSGCLYAVRRSCHTKLAKDMIDDFAIATEIHLQGLRTVYEPDAIAIEETNERSRDELRMRVRVIEQTLRVLARYRAVLNLRRHGWFAWQMFSHKVLRYLVPFWLLAALLSNWRLAADSVFYRVAFIAQCAACGLVLAGWCADRWRLRLGLLAVPYYFVLANAASVLALLKFLRGQAHVTWEPVRQPRTS